MHEFSKLRLLSCEYKALRALRTLPRIVYDYELDFHYGGTITQYINGTRYEIQKDHIVFRRPGQTVCSEGDYMCRLITFDLSGAAPFQYGPAPRLTSKIVQKTGMTPLLDHIPTAFVPHHREDILALFERIEACARYYRGSEEEKDHILNTTLLELLLLLCSDAVRSSSRVIIPVNSAVSIACRHIEFNYMNELSIGDLAALVHISGDHLIRIFRQETGMTPIAYINAIRLKNARLMLENTDLRIDEISEECGFSNTAYFIKRFRESFGVTPKKYRTLHCVNLRFPAD